ncbi:MAG: Rieske (2Fe-2S) protein [Bryobacteraceae bacterium]|nr:Rieske (2Fe-2S) protein [Bryobacteraceae bacterium]
MPLVAIAHGEQVREGQPFGVRIAGQDLVLCRVEGEIYALDGVCPHVGGPLAHGALHGRMLVCPWHAWEFDCVTGEHDRHPACRLRTYPVTQSDGQVWVTLD